MPVRSVLASVSLPTLSDSDRAYQDVPAAYFIGKRFRAEQSRTIHNNSSCLLNGRRQPVTDDGMWGPCLTESVDPAGLVNVRLGDP